MQRESYLQEIISQFDVHSVCAILGPRQVGKTTLAHAFVDLYYAGKALFLDLENPIDLARLENPMLALSDVEEPLIVIDEIQLRPELFPILRVLVDDRSKTRKFLILGSASRDLLRQSSETLAGRIGYVELYPFSLPEVKDEKKLWLRGGFPRSYLAQTDVGSYTWRQSYITTFLERDLANFGFDVPAAFMRRFWLMLSHYHGQTFNASEIGRSLDISDHTARRYVDILSGTFMIRVLQPWFANIGKRQVKSPKIYFRDSGILNALIGVSSISELRSNPKLGAFWEGFAIEQIIRFFRASTEEVYFWATHGSAELDLLIIKNGKRIGFEFKYADAPKITRSMHIASDDLGLDHLAVMYPGEDVFPMQGDGNIAAYGLKSLASGLFAKAFARYFPVHERGM